MIPFISIWATTSIKRSFFPPALASQGHRNWAPGSNYKIIKLHLCLEESGTDGGACLRRAMSACARNSLFPHWASPWAHSSCVLSQCPTCSAHLLGFDLGSAPLSGPDTAKLPHLLWQNHSSWTVSQGIRKETLHCLQLPYVHFIISYIWNIAM